MIISFGLIYYLIKQITCRGVRNFSLLDVSAQTSPVTDDLAFVTPLSNAGKWPCCTNLDWSKGKLRGWIFPISDCIEQL